MKHCKLRPIKWLHFINEAHPIFPNISFSFLHFVAFYLFAQSFLDLGAFSWTRLLLGVLTFSTVILALRACDELKDQETDILHFPKKPLVTGIVARHDLTSLILVAFALVFVSNLIFLQLQTSTLLLCSIAFYSWLSFKWFFIEGFVKERIGLSFFLQSPLVYFVLLYNLSLLQTDSASLLSVKNLFLVASFGLCVSAKEISKKIRQEKEETDYLTYSQSWGRVFSAYFMFSIIAISTALFLFLVYEKVLHSSNIYFVLAALPICSSLQVLYRLRRFTKLNLSSALLTRSVEKHSLVLLWTCLALGLTKHIEPFIQSVF